MRPRNGAFLAAWALGADLEQRRRVPRRADDRQGDGRLARLPVDANEVARGAGAIRGLRHRPVGDLRLDVEADEVALLERVVLRLLDDRQAERLIRLE